jgi:hypothetical protein
MEAIILIFFGEIPSIFSAFFRIYFLVNGMLLDSIERQSVQPHEVKCSRAEKWELALALVLATLWLWLTVT